MKEQKGHGCDTPLQLCVWELCFHSVGLFSHNNGAVPPSQPRKCQNVFSTCEWVSTGGKCAKGRVKSCRESESDGADGSEQTGSKCYLLISQSKKPPEETHTDRYHQSVVQVMKTLSRTQTQPAAAAVHAGLFSAALVGEDAVTETSSAGINND